MAAWVRILLYILDLIPILEWALGRGVLVDLQAGETYFDGFTEDILISIENVLGTNDNDTLNGSSDANLLRGWVGDDFIDGRGGDDTLEGNTGNDTFAFRPGDGNDHINDFQSGDLVDLIGFGALFNNANEVLDSAAQVGAHVVLKLDVHR